MKKIVFAVLIGWCQSGLAQQADDPAWRFGFSTGVEFQTLHAGFLPHQTHDPYPGTPGKGGAGVSLGVWGAWQLLPALSIRPELHFSRSSGAMRFIWDDGQELSTRYPFSEIELPVHFILSNRLKHLPVQALVLFGGRFSWNVAHAPANPPIYLLAERIGLDIGIGARIYWDKWEIQPELVYSYGMNNAHDYQNTPYDRIIGRILRDRLSLRLAFGLPSRKSYRR